MPRYAYLLLPLIGGAMIAAQAPVNARLRLVLGSPVGSALVSFAVGTVLLFGAVVVAVTPPASARWGAGPGGPISAEPSGRSSCSPSSWHRRAWASPRPSSPPSSARWPWRR